MSEHVFPQPELKKFQVKGTDECFDIPTGLISGGLTKRELFAAMAMQAMVANDCYWNGNDETRESTATDAVSYADALIAELAKAPPASEETEG